MSTSSQLMQVGDTYKNFVLKSSVAIPEVQAVLVELTHIPTGATVMHLMADDDENLFCLSFRTWPQTSNGVAHILEHTVLCGSDQFPVKDPFFAMSRRSLNTFMNALTGADFTCYPASSQVPKDFYNLLEVYLDAVFHPILDKSSFLQEGHRLEFKKPDDPNTPLCIKGVVFNEMKGSLSNPDARLGEAVMEALFPNLTYGVNSGGDPKVIPTLTYDELKEFHQTFYHPSRCLFFFYGDLPLEQHLDMIEEKALKDVQKADPFPPLPKQPRFKKKLYKTLPYPIAENEELKEKNILGIGWLTCSILEQEELLALSVIDLVLTGTDASPLKMALLKSGLCKQTDATLESELSEVPYFIVCKGCPDNASVPIEALIRETLETTCREGFPTDLVEGAIHQLEFSRYEITGNSSPYGLSLFFHSALLWQHGGKPEEGLMVHSLFRKLREKVKNKDYLPGLIRKYFLENPHFVSVEMYPDTELAAKELFEEEEQLRLTQASLSDHTIQSLVDQAQELIRLQEEEENQNLDVLPKVTLDDVPKQGKEFSLIQEKIGNWKVFHHPCFTNDILYADLVFDLPFIAEEDLPFLRLFTLFLPQIGCGGRSYAEQLDQVLEHTGGIGVSIDLSPQVQNPLLLKPMFSLRGKTLHRKVDKFFPLLRDVLLSADFTDVERLKELLMQHFHGLQHSIHHQSLRYAVNLAASGLCVPSRIVNSWYGLEYYEKLKNILHDFEHKPHFLIEKMQLLQNSCLGLQGGHLVLSGDEKMVDRLRKEDLFGLQQATSKPYPEWTSDYAVFPVASQGRLTASPVAFTVLMLPSISYTHPDAPLLSLGAEIMENNVLHKRVREQGGAYGVGAVHALLSGHFYFYSYRDPLLFGTLEAFTEAANEIASGDIDEVDLEEAKLGMIQEMDTPCAPGSRAMTAYSRWRTGRTPELRQAFRERLLAADIKGIRKAVQKHLLPQLKEGTIVTFAGKELLERENLLFKERPLPLFTIE